MMMINNRYTSPLFLTLVARCKSLPEEKEVDRYEEDTRSIDM